MNKKKNVRESNILGCNDCNQKAQFFHSKCCNSHFEGILGSDGSLMIACENCGKPCGKIENPTSPIILPAHARDETGARDDAGADAIIIYEGGDLLVWKDGDNYFFNTPKATLNFKKEEWIKFKRDLSKLADL